MSKKVWRRPEVKLIEAGGAENGKSAGQDSKGTPNAGS